MASSTALPAGQLIALLLLAPPIGACIWRLMARGWAMGVGGGRISERARRWEAVEFRWLIVICYAIEVVMVIIAFAKGTI
ncbi:MAG: hypothetical protein ACRD13_11640 [Terriglobales bacterium]